MWCVWFCVFVVCVCVGEMCGVCGFVCVCGVCVGGVCVCVVCVCGVCVYGFVFVVCACVWCVRGVCMVCVFCVCVCVCVSIQRRSLHQLNTQ